MRHFKKENGAIYAKKLIRPAAEYGCTQWHTHPHINKFIIIYVLSIFLPPRYYSTSPLHPSPTTLKIGSGGVESEGNILGNLFKIDAAFWCRHLTLQSMKIAARFGAF